MDLFVRGFLICMAVAAMCVSLVPDIYNTFVTEEQTEVRVVDTEDSEARIANLEETADWLYEYGKEGRSIAYGAVDKVVALESRVDGVESGVIAARSDADAAESTAGDLGAYIQEVRSSIDKQITNESSALASQIELTNQRVDGLEKTASAMSQVSRDAQSQANYAVQIAGETGKSGWFVWLGSICGILGLCGCGYLVWRLRDGR